MATILHTEAVSYQSPDQKGFAGISRAQKRGSPSIIVKDGNAPQRVSVSHGLSHHERDLLTEGFDHMRQRGPGLFVSVEAGRSPDAENVVRALTRRVKNDIAQPQRRACMRRVVLNTALRGFARAHTPTVLATLV